MAYRKVFCDNCKQKKEGYKLGRCGGICLECAKELIEGIIRREQEEKVKYGN